MFLNIFEVNQNNEVIACFCFQQFFIFPLPVHKNQRVDILFVCVVLMCTEPSKPKTKLLQLLIIFNYNLSFETL